ncbi:MAG: transporter substrate-binding domain-containing protein, partial [Acidobacteriota bacterium]|nr:transporter substrate-binding domain-containing protein [Acidobacteriota bacterium]
MAASGAVVAAAVGVFLLLRPKAAFPAAIRVGIDHSPPFYIIDADGSVKGLAVDVLDEAARRRNIHLIWTPLHDIPLDDALAKRLVQLWPLVGSTPERRAHFYLSKPWLESDYILASLRAHPIRTPADAAGLAVAQARLKFTTIIARQYLARSKMIVRTFRAD